MTREQELDVKELYNSGWSPEEIAEELGLDELEVMDFCADLLADC